MFKHYLSIAMRNLLHNKFQTLFTIMGLAVAFFCFVICAYFVRGFMSMDKYYENHDRVLMLRQSTNLSGVSGSFDFKEYQNQFPEVESYFRMMVESNQYQVEGFDKNVELLTIECDTTLRHIYNPRLIAGSWEAAQNSINSMVMTETYATKLFGSPLNAIGRQLSTMGGKRYSSDAYSCPTYTIQAVVEDLPFNNTLRSFSAMHAWVMNDTDGALTRGSYIYDPRILLAKGTDKQAFINKLADASVSDNEVRYIHNVNGEDVEEKSYLVASEPFDVRRMWESYAVFVTILLAILTPGFLILLSALSNFFHLLISNIMMRRREYTLRRAHGAHTMDLWVMVGTQVVITMLLVGFVTMIIVELCSPILHISLDSENQFIIDKKTMLIQSAQHIAVLILIGFGVAWLAVARIRKDSLQESLKTSTGRKPGNHIGRNIMMGFQMTIGFIFILLLSALLLQIRKSQAARIPWLSMQEKKEIITIPLSVYDTQVYDELNAQLKSIPSIKEIIFSDATHFRLDYGWDDYKTLNEKGDTLRSYIVGTRSGLMQFMNVPLIEGRWSESPDEALVDLTYAYAYNVHLGDRITVLNDINPIRFWGKDDSFVSTVTVVGIIDNVVEKTTPVTGTYNMGAKGIYLWMDTGGNHFSVKCYPGQIDAMRKSLSDLIEKRNPELSGLVLETLADQIYSETNTQRQFLKLFWLFAGIALTITLLGIYSAITMDTTMRRKEMAIRKINGAKPRQIIVLFGKFYLRMMLVTAAIAFPVSYIFFNFIKTAGYREVFNYGFLYYLSIFLLMALFVALTVGVQIFRIARIEPAKVVKSE